MKKIRALLFILICLQALPAGGQEFDPATDGWFFGNWGEDGTYCIDSCDFSWDLYRKTYLGINPTHDCVEAPLDCAFYEIFKNCAKGGNCGGMSLLALALFKYGGYMGYCSPANFYTGTKSPDRDDLHRAIKIMQARQFSASGITNFIDVVDAGKLNHAEAAYNEVKEALGKGDYPVLSIANDTWGDAAHTVIPYRIEEFPHGNAAYGYPPGTKIMYIWDPNHPYDDDPNHYDSTSTANRMVIKSPTDWTYTSGTRTYTGTGISGGWCFCIPMSYVLHKSRQPMALDMVFDALMSVFVGGPGAAVSQISDDAGRRLYKTDKDIHTLRGDLETDSAKRLKGVARWPWYGARRDIGRTTGQGTVSAVAGSQTIRNAELPGELYFIRRPVGSQSPLNITLSGKKYRAILGYQNNIIEIETDSRTASRDRVTLSGFATAAQTLQINTLGSDEKTFSIKQLRTGAARREWKSFDVRNLRIRRDMPVKLAIAGDMNELLVSSSDRTVSFDLNVRQRFDGQLSEKKSVNLSTQPGKTMRIAPTDWNRLEKSDLAIMAAKQVLEPTSAITAAFRITDISYEKRIPTDQGTTLKIFWQGEARFPVTVKYRPKPGSRCPKGDCLPIVMHFGAEANPIVCRDVVLCYGDSGGSSFDYEIVLRDATGRETTPVAAPFECLAR